MEFITLPAYVSYIFYGGLFSVAFKVPGAINGTAAIVTVPVAKSLKTYVFLWTVKRNDPALELICWLTEN